MGGRLDRVKCDQAQVGHVKSSDDLAGVDNLNLRWSRGSGAVVARLLAKEKVAGSTPVSRSTDLSETGSLVGLTIPPVGTADDDEPPGSAHSQTDMGPDLPRPEVGY